MSAEIFYVTPIVTTVRLGTTVGGGETAGNVPPIRPHLDSDKQSRLH